MRRSICLCLAVLLLACALSAQASELKLTGVPAEFQYLKLLDNGYVGIAYQEELRMIGYDGQELLSVPLSVLQEGDHAYSGIPACCEDGEGGLFVLFTYDVRQDEPLMHLYHISAAGDVLWSAMFQQTTVWGWNHLARDGQGGVYLTHSSWDNYKESMIRHFSADGTILWKKLLQADGLVFGPYVARPAEDGGFLLYGTAVSKSKGVYKALEMHIGPDGDIQQSIARDFSLRPDYSAFLKWEPTDGQIHFVSRANYPETQGTERVEFLLADLKECPLPKITLTDADSTAH
ncbi:MAG: hypothetical protein J6K72_06030 [Clostridia bacterium]|nr:hypothetical protein [Clostridia bacterium]